MTAQPKTKLVYVEIDQPTHQSLISDGKKGLSLELADLEMYVESVAGYEFYSVAPMAINPSGKLSFIVAFRKHTSSETK